MNRTQKLLAPLAILGALASWTYAATTSGITHAATKLDAATAALGQGDFVTALKKVTSARTNLTPAADFPRSRAELTAAQQAILANDAVTATRRVANAHAILAALGSGTVELKGPDTVTGHAVSELLAASKGLLLESESDRPFEKFIYPGVGTPNTAGIQAAFGLAATSPAEELTATDWFDNRAVIVDTGLDPAVSASRVKGLRAAIRSQLTSVHVFRVGTIEVQVVIVGKTASGRWVGLKSVAIET